MALKGSGAKSGEGGRGGGKMAFYVIHTLFFTVSPVKRTLGKSLNDISFSFRVKDQSQTPCHSLVHAGVAEAAVQPAVGVRDPQGRVTVRCGSFHIVVSSGYVFED